jgi:hypothetical protein
MEGMLSSAKLYRVPGYRIPESRAQPTPLASFVRTTWRFICHLGAIMEALTLTPLVAIVAIPLFIYRWVKGGYYEILFNSKMPAGQRLE